MLQVGSKRIESLFERPLHSLNEERACGMADGASGDGPTGRDQWVDVEAALGELRQRELRQFLERNPADGDAALDPACLNRVLSALHQ